MTVFPLPPTDVGGMKNVAAMESAVMYERVWKTLIHAILREQQS